MDLLTGGTTRAHAPRRALPWLVEAADERECGERHQQEAMAGNDFEIDVTIEFKSTPKITSLHQTIDYVSVYEVIKKQMIRPVALLETLAHCITDEIYLLDQRITKIDIRINKLHPPIKNFIGNVGVSYFKVFD